MIYFTYDWDYADEDRIYAIFTTACTGRDGIHANQIYEQLDAELAFNL